MRHSRRAHFTGNGFLLKVAERNIAPDISRIIDQYSVRAGQPVKQLSHIVMGLNLGGVGVVVETQLLNKVLGNGLPVNLWVG